MAVSGKALTRRQLLRAGTAGACCTLARPLGVMADEAKARRPNILVIVTDDQRWDAMGCAGNPIIRTPCMDALAAEGTRFTNAFVTTSICAASRASILTGLHERTHGFTFGTPPLASGFVEKSYPFLLRQAGYRTGFVGKFGIKVEKGATGRMFDFFQPLGRNPYFKEIKGRKVHLTDLTAEEAISFLQGCTAERPFCLSVSFNAPHAEDGDPKQYIWPQAVDSLYRDAAIPVPKSAAPDFFDRQPEFLKQSLNRIRWGWRFDTPEKHQQMVKGYYRMVSGVDAAIGRLLAELRRLGLDDNTVVMLIGDNGYFLGERGFAGKWLMYEESIRVPLIIAGPRRNDSLQHGASSDAFALNIDLAPTILDLAGVNVPGTIQGRSLVPLLSGRTVEWRKDFFYEHLFERDDIPKCEGVRTDRWKYIRYFERKPVYEELYDLDADPGEETNLVSSGNSESVLATLRLRCDALRNSYGGPYVSKSKKAEFKPTPKPSGYVEGVKGRAAEFNGRNAYLHACMTPAIARDGEFTWSFWAWVHPQSSRSGVILGNRRIGKRDTLQFMKVTRETIQYFGGEGGWIKMRHGIPASKWVHVAVVKDSRSVSCYVDGRRTAFAHVDFDMPSLPLYLGGDPNAREMATCRVDEVRVYGRALGEEEIDALHDLEEVDVGLAGYWPLDGAGTRAEGKAH